MNWRDLVRLVTVDDSIMDKQFVLTPPPQERQRQSSITGADATNETAIIAYDLAGNRKTLDSLFHLPLNADVVVRDFRVGGRRPVAALAVFVDGLVDKNIINMHILEPLMVLTEFENGQGDTEWIDWVQHALLPGNQVMEVSTWKDAVENILSGSTVVFFEGVNTALSVETKGWEHRSVSASQTEAVVRGPHDAFTENFRSNTGLIRSRLRCSNLITEMTQVGALASTDVAVMYIQGVVNPKLIKEVKRRIAAVNVDYLADSGIMEQFIEDDPSGVIPKFLSTERPDRVAQALTEGQFAVFVGHSPYALVAPVLFWSLLQTAEDAYLRWPFGSFIRLIRVTALAIGLLLPALYIAVTNYHPEMIPTDLMLAVAASRERVPFPVVFEVLIMEFSLELIREAGIRIPSVIGPTIGIVGALILGQAAVAAGIISPLLIIVVAVTALGSFTMPNYNLSFTVRVLRFGFIIASSLLGFYGVTLGLMLLIMHAASVRSFGVPILSPIAPRRKSSRDVVLRGQVFTMEDRPSAYMPLDARRQAPITRPWSAAAPAAREKRGRRRRRSGRNA
ncbi:MAG: spore germination protein [Bacilli bacterium]